MDSQNDLIFALDIGTRTIIGLVLKYEEPIYKILAAEVVEHDTRAMMDGQIHNVREVARQVEKIKKVLEDSLDIELKRAAIAAAGRALRTENTEYSMQFAAAKKITEEDVKSLELGAIQQSKRELGAKKDYRYHFVDYSVREYYLDDIYLADLVGQRGKNVKVKLVATFLPVIVIDSLLSVISEVGLEVEHMTLEPIAASKIIIPEEMYNFNLALIDIGAGTSDIALTKGGSMLGYGMVPCAGDEITEKIAEHYLLDYNTAEKAKRSLSESDTAKVENALGKQQTIHRKEFIEIIEPEVKKLTDKITDKIIELNGTSPRAVICIGGGSLTPLLVPALAKSLELSEERIGIRSRESLDNIEGGIGNISSTQSITPLGIGLTAHGAPYRNVYINVEVNGSELQLYTLKRPRVEDALVAADIDVNQLSGRPGKGLTCTVNDDLEIIKGEQGKPGLVKVNGEQSGLETRISSGDQIKFIPGEKGADASPIVADVLPESINNFNVIINGTEVQVGLKIWQNGKVAQPDDEITDGAEIEYKKITTAGEAAAEVMGIDSDLITDKSVEVVGDKDRDVYPLGPYYLLDENNQLVSPQTGLNRRLNLEVKKVDFSESSPRIKEVIAVAAEKITIIFNNSELEIPVAGISLYCNGRSVDADYRLQDGDRIKIEKKPITIKDVFDYIQYDISGLQRKKTQLTVNGQPANFDDEINDGDRLKIQFRVNGA